MMAEGFQFNFRQKEFNRRLSRATSVGLKRAAVFYHARCRQAVNVANTGERRTRTRDTVAGAKGSGYTVYNKPSQPGEAPHKITGKGQSEIVWEHNDQPKRPAVRVGVKKGGMHMIFLEVGTKTIASRPWLLATLEKFWAMIGKLAATGGASGVGK